MFENVPILTVGAAILSANLHNLCTIFLNSTSSISAWVQCMVTKVVLKAGPSTQTISGKSEVVI